MSPEADRRVARLTPGRDGVVRLAVLCSAVLACLVSAPAMAHDGGRPDLDPPCNDLCRAWMSWRPERRAASEGQPQAPSGKTGDEARPDHSLAALSPRAPAPLRARRVGAPARPKRLEARGPARDEEASASRRTSSPPRVVPPQQSSALVSTPAEPVEAAADGGSPVSGRASVHVDLPREGDANRLRSDLADAAVLARPLYRPPSVTDAPSDRPEALDGPHGGETGPQAPDHAMSPAEVRRDDRDATDAVLTPAETSSALRAAPPDTALPSGGPSQPASASAGAPPSATRQAADQPAVVARSRTAPVRTVPVPALPASDLERLDEARPFERPVAIASPPTTPVPPTAGVLLLGGLAILSLVGVRRRQPASDPT